MDYSPITMALITSECDAMRSPEHQMALITSDCVPSRTPWGWCAATAAAGGARYRHDRQSSATTPTALRLSSPRLSPPPPCFSAVPPPISSSPCFSSSPPLRPPIADSCPTAAAPRPLTQGVSISTIEKQADSRGCVGEASAAKGGNGSDEDDYTLAIGIIGVSVVTGETLLRNAS